MMVRTVVLWVVLAFFGASAQAAGVFYVDKFGDDNNSCNRALPCLTITEAIERAGTNGRVIVGPGVYNEAFNITHTGLRLTSSSGADTTVINMRIAGNTDLRDYGIGILADRVVLGQRNKGFTIRGGLNNFDVYALGNNIRIEGNRIEFGLGSRSVVMLGDNLTLRYNTLDSKSRDAVVMSRPVVNEVGGKRWLIDNNIVRNTSTAFSLMSTAPNNRNRVTNNVVENSRADGFLVENREVFEGSERSLSGRSGDRYLNNSVFHLDGTGGSGFSFTGGNPQADRLRVSLAELDDSAISFTNTNNASLRDSVFIGEQLRQPDPNVEGSNYGIFLGGAKATRIQGNSFTNFNFGIWGNGDLSDSKFLNNNFSGATTCMFNLFSGAVMSNVQFKRNYWGASGAPDVSCNAVAQALVDNGAIRFQPASSPN